MGAGWLQRPLVNGCRGAAQSGFDPGVCGPTGLPGLPLWWGTTAGVSAAAQALDSSHGLEGGRIIYMSRYVWRIGPF